MRVLVIGAGWSARAWPIGSRLAARRSWSWRPATRPERRPRAAFAWINSRGKQPAAYHRLNADGMMAHHRLGADLGGAPWFHDTGTLTSRATRRWSSGWSRTSSDCVGSATRPRSSTRPRRRARAAVECPQAGAFAYFAREGWADGPTLVRTLARGGGRARDRGSGRAASSRRSSARGVDRGPGRDGSRPAGDTRAEAGAAGGPGRRRGVGVDCGRPGRDRGRPLRRPGRGRWLARSWPLARPAACSRRRHPSEVRTAPDHLPPGVHMRRNSEGRYVIAGTATRMTRSRPRRGASRPAGCQILLERVRRYVPALREARVERAHIGIRALPADGTRWSDSCRARRRSTWRDPQRDGRSGRCRRAGRGRDPGAAPDPRLASFRPERLVTRV